MTLTLTVDQLRQFALDTQQEAYAAGYRQAKAEHEDVWYKPSEAAKRLGLKSASAIYRLIAAKRIPATKFGDEYRISATDLRDAMSRGLGARQPQLGPVVTPSTNSARGELAASAARRAA